MIPASDVNLSDNKENASWSESEDDEHSDGASDGKGCKSGRWTKEASTNCTLKYEYPFLLSSSILTGA